MTDEKKKIEEVNIQETNLEELTQLAIAEAISYGHYLDHERTGAGQFSVTYNNTGTTSILHQKLSEIEFYEDSEKTEIDHEEGTKTVFFEYNPERQE